MSGFLRYLRLRYPFLILPLAVIIIGTAGYVYIERMSPMDGLYMTVITITTVGYREVRDLSKAGQIYTMLLLFPGIATTFVAATQIGLDATAWAARRDRQRRLKETERMQNHYIVCGYGRMGQIVTRLLQAENAKYVVVEWDPNKAADLREASIPVVEGDASLDETLEKAGVKNAQGLVALLKGDADNVYVTLTARGLNASLFILARASSDEVVPKLYRAGANKVVNPYDSAGTRIATTLLRPVVLDFMDVLSAPGDVSLGMEEILVQPGSALDGKSLRESGIREKTSAMVVAVRKWSTGEFSFNPTGSQKIDAGDVLLALGPSSSISGLASLAQGRAEPPPDSAAS